MPPDKLTADGTYTSSWGSVGHETECGQRGASDGEPVGYPTRALFGSDGPDSMSSGSDVTEAQHWGPPDGEYPVVGQSGLSFGNDFLEEAWSPSREMEDAVARLQNDLAEYRKELRYSGVKGPANPSQTTRRSGFTSTPVPRYLGKSSWEQYRQVFEAIACSNGWLFSYFFIWMEMLSMWPCWFRSPSGCYWEF